MFQKIPLKIGLIDKRFSWRRWLWEVTCGKGCGGMYGVRGALRELIGRCCRKVTFGRYFVVFKNM